MLLGSYLSSQDGVSVIKESLAQAKKAAKSCPTDPAARSRALTKRLDDEELESFFNKLYELLCSKVSSTQKNSLFMNFSDNLCAAAWIPFRVQEYENFVSHNSELCCGGEGGKYEIFEMV